ncbi:SRPBCC family protein [Tersicoccus sp. MR15.9]|uniref:SRPBCC family protein n=1 Tax=Tersicoccus mangrovi TaxID=3121635 RepID=UPI002FE5509B
MSSFAISRSRVIDAPAETLFPLVDDFHRWTAWSPWEGAGPQLERTYSGPTAGVGARYSWRGDRKAGTGSMEITESVPHTRIGLTVEFTKPFKAVNPTTFTFDAAGGGSTRVTWTMTGQNRGLWSLVARIVPMDKLVGEDFEKGLEQLAAAATRGWSGRPGAAAGDATDETGREEHA